MSTVHSRAIRPGRDDSRMTRWASRTASRTLWVTKRTEAFGLAPDPGQLVVQHIAGDGVERGERLVHQQQLAVLGERPGHRHALAHPAGELVHPLPVRPAEAYEFEQPLRLRPAVRLRYPAQPQGEFDVLARGQPREEGVLLEHQGRPPAGGLDGPRGRAVESGHQVEQGRFAAPGRSQEGDELAGSDIERDVVQDELLPRGPGEGLGHVLMRAACSTAARSSALVRVVVAMVVTSWES